ncbi:recombination protein RecR [Gluconacetobacter diazotrophicus PA1 5]|uniref:Recombination protein RecR n=2 Tax=Gluconacetobacter diazotrophicus TaxID=33996 RepID=A9H477_GLUDA|nr:recombination mediator RecR [Gluconacetobacter diazotrophicus]ACI52642.1 recombination protein RecR [Gluconacetobacter diazotrophicus PA1 5]MBB2156395.1 recombination protein RecR [Gluconacetobacter diazotrophicus]TWB06049.1 DNA replication and repair protein RecR [Gluconacetobacter diazotrophicus]CAP57409.1 putative recombination protein recR [Gluconacetobacter diazotrophicus PA1 5]
MGGTDIERLIALLARLPGLGPRSARRAALALLRQPQARMLPLAQAMEQAARSVRTCSSCGNLDTHDPCTICADPGRDRGLVCVVETVGDLWALERAGVHRGVYQVLGGTLSALAGMGPDDLNVASLLARIEQGGVREIILALGATVDGATTAHWLQDRLAAFDVPVSRVGQGVPMGGALDVLDDGTLAAALMARRPA